MASHDALPPCLRNCFGSLAVKRRDPRIKQVFVDAFYLFDGDGNGHLDLEEVTEALDALKVEAGRAQAVFNKYVRC